MKCGRKRKWDELNVSVSARIPVSIANQLPGRGKRSEFIQKAIAEKLERDSATSAIQTACALLEKGLNKDLLDGFENAPVKFFQ